MATYPWNAGFNGAGLETFGNACEIPNEYFFSPLALVTHGFIYGLGDIWFNLDNSIIQNVTWTPV